MATNQARASRARLDRIADRLQIGRDPASVRQRLESMDARFASWDRRYPGAWDAVTRRAVRDRASRLEADVCRAAGVEPVAVGRLRWTAAALAVAGATRATVAEGAAR